MTYISYTTKSCTGASIWDAFAQTFKDLGYPTTIKQAVTEKKSEVREQTYFEKMLDLRYENECLKREKEVLKAENQSLKEKLNKVYDFMRLVTINGMNMLEHFLRSIGEWVQQKVAGMSR